MKPLPLMERAIANSSTEGDLVLDPFAGSGSTLIACERTAGVVRRWNLIPLCRRDPCPLREFSGSVAERIDE